MASDRATFWSVTINNPTVDDHECVSVARAKGWRVDGQVECGENGTPHFQLLVKTPQVRFSALKKTFPRGHIEIARNPAALSKYVVKEETRVADLPEQNNKYPSLSRLYDLIWERFDTNDKEGWDFFDESKYPRFYSDRLQDWIEADPLDWLDAVARDLIDQGYFVEHHICNPSVRAAWKRFHKNILSRSRQRVLEIRRQTDRQTDNLVQTVEIPLLEDDINNANDEEEVECATPASSRDGTQGS